MAKKLEKNEIMLKGIDISREGGSCENSRGEGRNVKRTATDTNIMVTN